MHDASCSNPVRLWLEADGVPVSYDVRISAPSTDLDFEQIDVREQLSHDELDATEVQGTLRRLAERQESIARIVLRYGAGAYVLSVLVDPLTTEGMHDAQFALEELRKNFAGHRLIVHVLGPDQKSSPQLTAADGWTIYRDVETVRGRA